MPVLSQPNNESTAIVKNTEIPLNWGPDNQFQGRIPTMLVQDGCVPSGFRMEKVHVIRRQLANGPYDIDKRLDAALDRLFKKLNA